MTLIEIENLSAALGAAELKARKAELVDAAAAADAAELAARYVQARIDARMRDEKLAEQGRTIGLLQDALEKAKQVEAELRGAKERAAALEAAIAELTAKQEAESRQAAAALDAAIADLTAKLDAEACRATAATALARERRAVLANLQVQIAPLLAAE